MAHYGTLKDARVTDAADDIRGSHLYGLNDEKLGKIDDVIFDHSTGNIRYVVVETGGWLSTKKFLVPAEGLRASAKHENDFEANLDKRQVESFPRLQRIRLGVRKPVGWLRRALPFEVGGRSRNASRRNRPQHYTHHPANLGQSSIGAGSGPSSRMDNGF